MIESQVNEHSMEENKKRNASLAGLDKSPVNSIVMSSPPFKKLKQCRLPFKTLTPSPVNHKPVMQIDQGASKRKHVVSENSEPSLLGRTKVSENKSKITPVKKIKAINKSTSDAEVSSSSEDTNPSRIISPSLPVLVSEADSSSQTPKRAVLDQFFHKTQQPEVSTSDGEDVTERSCFIINGDTGKLDEKQDNNQLEMVDQCVDVLVKSPAQESPDTSVQKSPICEEKNTPQDEGCSSNITDTPRKSKVSICSPTKVDEEKNNSQASSLKTGIFALDTTPVRVISGATPVRVLSTPVTTDKTPEVKEKTTPVNKGKTPNKTPKLSRDIKNEILRKEKKQKLEEERAEKQRLREEAKATKEKERLEAKHQKELEKERKEKEKQAKKQKEEEEKQEIMRVKEEEKKKKQAIIEAKLEEKRKKEDEKQKQIEEEKRINEEKKLKKEKQEKAFRNFFTKAPECSTIKEKWSENVSCGPFAAFELKEGMMLAPRVRRVIDEDKKKELKEAINNQTLTASYLNDIKCNGFKPGKDVKTAVTSSSDTQVIPDGKQLVKCKFLYFHDNYRPAFYGTMRKTSKKINPRNPFAMDEILDYEVDSDEEWEEPGESLSNSEGEDDPASDDDEDDDGFFVPHGYLSEDEGGNDCEDGIKKLKEKQAAKAQAWEAGLKKKIETLTPVLIGPVWEGERNDTQSKHWKALQQFAAIVLVNTPIPTSYSQLSSTDITEHSATGECENKHTLKRKGVPKEAMPDLIRLVHGNTAGIKALSRSFREFWDQKNNDSTKNETDDSSHVVAGSSNERGPSPVNNLADNPTRPSTPSIECDFSISARQMKLKINKIAVREKRNGYDRECWYVDEEILKKYNLMDLPVPNTTVKEKKLKNTADTCSPVSTPKINQIAQFAKKLSPEAYQKQTQQNLAVLKKKQEQERIKKEQARALQLKLEQERLAKFRLEQEEKAALLRLQQEKTVLLKLQQGAQMRATVPPACSIQRVPTLNPFIQPTLLQSIPVVRLPQVSFPATPSLFNPNQPKNTFQPAVNQQTICPHQPQKTPNMEETLTKKPQMNQHKKTPTVIEILAKKAAHNVLKSNVVTHCSVGSAKECVPQNMEVDCGYSGDCEGQGN
ncbi:chromatin assembly factor 1 subunit A-like [Anneissia japonica]|uniref:chromatin assembly factor 1 subunit A-like n=1 Tax=Anneissia japonica TaxID=1529436 RepID=UPI0014257943|nr:chromatin assembly factor 1 subunit A-like [Anneissia japonica]